MDEASINNRLSLIGAYATSKGSGAQRYFGRLMLSNGRLVLLTDGNLEVLKLDIPTLHFEEVSKGNALSLSNGSGTYTVFFANELNDSEGSNPSLSYVGVLIGWLFGVGKSRTPQLWLSEEQAALNKQYIQFLEEVLNSYQNIQSIQP